MFDRDNDPLYLQARLEHFIVQWHGYRKPWFGIAAEKIQQSRLPQPLAWLYGFAGEWQGRHYWDTLLGNQDCLAFFESLQIKDGKLVFVFENQGVWSVGTECQGDDPPVWARLEDGPWQLFDDSLTRFLVTFVLHETVFGCKHRACGDNLIERMTERGMHVSPLWLNHAYPWFIDDQISRPLSFHIADGRYLIMNDHWCGTNAEMPWESWPELFQPKAPERASVGLSPYEPMPADLQVPAFLRQSHLKNAIRRHEEEIKYHQSRCELFRQLLEDMDGKP